MQEMADELGVSVIVPVAEGDSGLRSILAQGHPRMEVVQVGGAFDLEGVRKIESQGGGRAGALSAAVQESDRPLIALLDGGVAWKPTAVATLSSVLRHLSEAFGAVAACRCEDDVLQVPGELNRGALTDLLNERGCALLFRSEALDETGEFAEDRKVYLLPDSQIAEPDPGSPPGVSVVIPAYNYAHFLPTAIDSALAQDHPNIEIIVVDDGSTDNTPEVAAGYGDRIRCIHQPNAGLSAARNTGIKAASHPFVAFLDADDEWLPGSISAVMREFEAHGKELGAVAGQSIFMDHEGVIVPFKSRVRDLPRGIEFADILLKTRFSPSSVVARRSVFDDCGMFDTTMRSSEDRDMWLRIAAKFKFVQLRERLLYVRNHSSSMSKNTDRMKANMKVTFRKAFALKAPGGRGPLVRMKVASFFHFQIAWMYFDEGRRSAALKEWLLSAILWPAFPDPAALNEPPFFRLRSLRAFLFG